MKKILFAAALVLPVILSSESFARVNCPIPMGWNELKQVAPMPNHASFDWADETGKKISWGKNGEPFDVIKRHDEGLPIAQEGKETMLHQKDKDLLVCTYQIWFGHDTSVAPTHKIILVATFKQAMNPAETVKNK